MFSSIQKTIEEKIKGMKSGAVFTIADFNGIAASETVSKTLSRLSEKGTIKKITRGIFWSPADKSPNPDAIARALARGNRWHVIPCGETALHLYGLLPDLPKIWTYVTDGTYRSYILNDLKIEFRHSTGKLIGTMSDEASLLIQVVKALGKERISDELLAKIRMIIGHVNVAKLLDETKNTTDWIAKAIRRMYEAELCSEN